MEANKRKRNDLDDALPNKMSCNNPNESVCTQLVYDNSILNIQQPLYVNQMPIVQNQQLVYHLEGIDGTQQNVIYVVVPENAPGVSVLTVPKDLQDTLTDSEIKTSGAIKLECNDIIDKNVMKFCDDKIKIEYVNPSNQSESGIMQLKSESSFTKENISKENRTWRNHEYRCDDRFCPKTFSSVYQKKIHMETHYFQESSEYKCNLCNMIFDKAINRNKHVETHSIPNNFKCKYCNKSFPYYTTLTKHVEQKECSRPSKLCLCQYCGSKFVSTKDLNNHLDTNLRICKCNAKICSDHAYQLHLNLCSLCKRSNQNRTKKLNSKEVIIVE